MNRKINRDGTPAEYGEFNVLINGGDPGLGNQTVDLVGTFGVCKSVFDTD